MKDEAKTKAQLISEINEMRKDVAELADLKIRRKRMEKILLEPNEEIEEAIITLRDTPQGYGIQTFVSYIWLHITGYSANELIGMPFFNLLNPKDRKAALSRYKRQMRGEILPGLYEMSVIKKDGTEVPVELTSAVTTYEEQLINILFIRNITKRKQEQEELKRSHEQLRNLSAHLRAAREGERRIIAREIHDELGQTLTSLKLDLSWLSKKLSENQEPLLEKLNRMTTLIDSTIKTVKRITTTLRPGLLDDLGISAAIEWHAVEFEERTGVRCTLDLEPDDLVLEQKLATAFFRIFEEALTNVSRHANATKINISLKKIGPNKLVLKVRDNGKGITEKQISHPKSFGLRGMYERAYFQGGKIKIKGVQNKGTVITLSAPLEKEDLPQLYDYDDALISP